MKQFIKLSEYAKNKSITYKTAWNHYKNNLIKGAFLDESNHVLIPIENINKNNNCIIYARVSSHDRKDSLIKQQKRLEEFAVLKGYNIINSYKEIASGMNDERKVMWRMIDSTPTRIVVENKDRLTRFGFSYLKKLLAKNGCEIVVINESVEDHADLIKDLTSIIYSFCARLYGMRRAKNKSDKCKEIISND